jgi:hypothetical protein
MLCYVMDYRLHNSEFLEYSVPRSYLIISVKRIQKRQYKCWYVIKISNAMHKLKNEEIKHQRRLNLNTILAHKTTVRLVNTD